MQNQRNTLIDSEKYIYANTPLANALLEGGEGWIQGRAGLKAGICFTERKKYIYRIKEIHLQNQRNTFTESGKYVYKTRRIQVHRLKVEGWIQGREVEEQQNWRNVLYEI